jgi:hypothetical protein
MISATLIKDAIKTSAPIDSILAKGWARTRRTGIKPFCTIASRAMKQNQKWQWLIRLIFHRHIQQSSPAKFHQTGSGCFFGRFRWNG